MKVLWLSLICSLKYFINYPTNAVCEIVKLSFIINHCQCHPQHYHCHPYHDHHGHCHPYHDHHGHHHHYHDHYYHHHHLNCFHLEILVQTQMPNPLRHKMM